MSPNAPMWLPVCWEGVTIASGQQQAPPTTCLSATAGQNGKATRLPPEVGSPTLLCSLLGRGHCGFRVPPTSNPTCLSVSSGQTGKATRFPAEVGSLILHLSHMARYHHGLRPPTANYPHLLPQLGEGLSYLVFLQSVISSLRALLPGKVSPCATGTINEPLMTLPQLNTHPKSNPCIMCEACERASYRVMLHGPCL